jgi:hypothetical protein
MRRSVELFLTVQCTSWTPSTLSAVLFYTLPAISSDARTKAKSDKQTGEKRACQELALCTFVQVPGSSS